jgi:hypothetical protein
MVSTISNDDQGSSPITILRDVGLLAEKAIYTVEDIALHIRRGLMDPSSKMGPHQAFYPVNSSILLDESRSSALNGPSKSVFLQDIVAAAPAASASRKRIVVVGSGWASHAFLKVADVENAEVVCISPRPSFIFTPMLPATACGTIESHSIIEPIQEANPFVGYFEGTLR